MKKTLDEKFATISPEDLNLLHVTDDIEEAVGIVEAHIAGQQMVGVDLPEFGGAEGETSLEGTRVGIDKHQHRRNRPDGANRTSKPAD
jgi:hypothetical protein